MTALDDFFTHYHARRPVNATFTGVHAHDHELPDWSLDGLAASDAEMGTLGIDLTTEYPMPAAVATLRDSPDLLDAELARGFLEIQQAEHASGHGPRGNPALWTGEAVFSVIALMIRDFAPIGDRVALVAERLRAIPRFLRAWEPREPAAVPSAWIEKAQRDAAGAAVLLSTGLESWLAAAAVPADLGHVVRQHARAALGAIREFVNTQATRPAAEESAMACGPELYDLLLARGHFDQRSRADLLGDARERFDAAGAQLEAAARSVAGSWADAQELLAARHPTPAHYLDAFASTWEECRAVADAANAVAWPDDWPIRYVPFPPWTADAAPNLYYLYYRSPAPFDAYTTYDYVVPPLPADRDQVERHLRAWNTSTIKLNHVVHHGAIGHHVQNWHAYHQRRSRIGAVAAVDCANRIGMFCGGSMAEGWACYATDLMEELGFLTPLEQLSQQHTRVRMLGRAIVDIELHQGTMSFGDAVGFYAERVGMSPDAARAEAVKNSMFPCTAIMYWLGTQGIHDLRDAMKRREGTRFSLRRFHGELLGYGAVPVPLVARMMTAGGR